MKKPPPTNKPTPDQEDEDRGIRLNKYVANAGIASRRKADELIAKGFVEVNGTVVKEMGYRVKTGDQVRFKGKVIKPEVEKIYILLNKPKNIITTSNDEKGRRTVLDLVRNVTQLRIYPVGRLDRNTTGLLLLTNDGDLAKKMTHPSHAIRKIYHVALDKPVTDHHLIQIAKGLTLEDGAAPVDNVARIKGKPLSEVGIELHIGRNRIVRRIFEHLGYEVKRLDRVYLGGLTKKDLPRGRHRLLTQQEIIMLKHFA